VIAPVAVGLATTSLLSRFSIRKAWLIGLGATATLVAPVPAAAGLFLMVAVGRFRSAARLARKATAERDAGLEASELVALGLAGGLSVAAAHRVALEHAAPEANAALSRLVVDMQVRGTRAALIDNEGSLAEASRVIAAAVASGAPALPALTGYLEVEAHRRHSQRVEDARKLPVRLLLPLTLLVLPGFVLLTVGSTVVGSLARLNS
jgi:hypothetical protein